MKAPARTFPFSGSFFTTCLPASRGGVFVGIRQKPRGQSTIEYLLMVLVGALFSLQIVRFFNDVFRDGLTQLEGSVAGEVRSGDGFGGK